jgi:hypothetical protein
MRTKNTHGDLSDRQAADLYRLHEDLAAVVEPTSLRKMRHLGLIKKKSREVTDRGRVYLGKDTRDLSDDERDDVTRKMVEEGLSFPRRPPTTPLRVERARKRRTIEAEIRVEDLLVRLVEFGTNDARTLAAEGRALITVFRGWYSLHPSDDEREETGRRYDDLHRRAAELLAQVATSPEGR